MAVIGNYVYVESGGAIIAGTRSNEIETSVETIEVSSPTQGYWGNIITGRKRWQLTTNYLMSTVDDLGDLLNVGSTYTLLTKASGGSSYLSGSAILTTCKITATVGNLVQGSFVFQGNGPLEAVTAQ